MRKTHAAISLVGLLLTPLLLTLSATAKDFTAQDRNHWAFQKLHQPQPPTVETSRRVRNPIDAFIQAPLEAKNISPSTPAEKATLLRRATLDLIGLPPTPSELEAFLADQSPTAFQTVVDRLLASPHYGERWARHWLDLARYAESEGFKADETRPNAWRYRDYVIKSLNDDKPYDRFIQEQIAGDELWPENPEARIATAFNRHYPDESNARNLRQRRQEILNDITDTVGSVFVGLTYACARCHDHKFDPIAQTDYYRLQAFFANVTADDNIMLASTARQRRYQEQLTRWEESTRAIREQMSLLEEPHRAAIIKEYVDKYPPEIQAALVKSESERSPFECLMVAKAKLYLNPSSHQYIGDEEAVLAKLKGEEKKNWQRLNERLQSFHHLRPEPLPTATGITDLGTQAPQTFLLNRGLYDSPQATVAPGFLSVLGSAPTPIPALQNSSSTGRRAALARLLTDAQNPLTARVLVNRVWHYHFGRGIVGTPSDFGLKGDPPTHPQLLDWLTSEFVQGGWSLKKMHRLIMGSHTYQQSADYRSEAAAVDPENKGWWRFPRHRLEGEAIRDASLALAGLLDPTLGGPSIFPELPEGMGARGGWKSSALAGERNRRSIYVFVRRNTRYPMFVAFDMPDTHESCARRNVTTSPVQALALLNSKTSLSWAQHFAARVLEAGGRDVNAQITAAYRLAYSRSPGEGEVQLARDFLVRQARIISDRSAAEEEEAALPPTIPERMENADAAALVDFCHMLMNANEFIYVN